MSSEKRNLISNPETTEKIIHLSNALVLYCRSQNERMSHKTAQITVGVLLLNPKWSHILSDNAAKHEKQTFLKACCSFLFDEKCISGITIRMQCFFYGRYLSRDAYKSHQKQILIRNSFHLLQKLKKVWHNASEDLKEMHNDLIQLVLIKEGMEEDKSAFDEMRTAVNSVFPPSALSTFVLSSQKTKMTFINEMSSIAAGVRLHAWYSQKAGKFMFDVGRIMKETLPKVCEDLHEEFNCVKERVEVLKSELKANEGEVDIDDTEDIYHQKLLLINLTNYFEFIKTLKENVDEVAVETYKLDYTFTMQIKELNLSLKTGPFIKADKIYPLYKDLAKTWKHLQLEGHLLTFYTNLFQDLKKFSERLNMIEPEEIAEDSTTEDVEHDADERAVIISPEEVKNFNAITIEYKEFCAFYCGSGILIPCDKNLGVIMYNNLCYGFSSKEAMDYFKSQPNKCIVAAIDCMIKIPQLIFTLQMEGYFRFPVLNSVKPKRKLPVFITDSSVQTVLHPAEDNIDYTYNWNQWTLRKQALKYVDLLDKKTHSTQTDLSHFRRENHSQVYLPKDTSTQTMKDAATNISRTGLPELYKNRKKIIVNEAASGFS